MNQAYPAFMAIRILFAVIGTVSVAFLITLVLCELWETIQSLRKMIK